MLIFPLKKEWYEKIKSGVIDEDNSYSYGKSKIERLEKENEQLKCDLYNTDANLQHITIEYEEENAKLKKENEQLKAFESHCEEIEEDAKAIAKEKSCCQKFALSRF